MREAVSEAGTTDDVQEALSAAMDGEATPDELHGVLDAASRDGELRAKWERMHFASAVMRGALATPEAVGTTATTAKLPRTKRRWRGYKPRGRVRLRLGPPVAAAVAVFAALAVILIAGLMQEEDEAPNLVAGSTQAPTDVLPPEQEAELAPIDRRRMNAYMLQHARYNAAAGSAGIPLARVLGDPPPADVESD